MTTTKMTQEEKDEFEFQVVLMLEEEREFNRKKLRETGYHRIGVLI
jgi:hypothetical protein